MFAILAKKRLLGCSCDLVPLLVLRGGYEVEPAFQWQSLTDTGSLSLRAAWLFLHRPRRVLFAGALRLSAGAPSCCGVAGTMQLSSCAF